MTVVDELNVKLHPLLLIFIVDLYNKPKAKAQLIYTTHDTTLLDRKFFRRDQIWFVQKDDYGYSELSALSDIIFTKMSCRKPTNKKSSITYKK